MSDAGKRTQPPALLATVRRLPRFLWRLARDRRVPWQARAALVGLALYLAMPFDLVPDWIPGLGYLDDVLVAGAVVGYVLARVPREVIAEHWGEDVEALERLRAQRQQRSSKV